jgi:hydroxyacyl-ACP dehydratase HTD2-like protein with hotdog domain
MCCWWCDLAGLTGNLAPATPEFTFSLRPDAKLLFHFSALTYNAHSIHIDPDYARNREGYKGLLVHGPLTLVLMIQALRACLTQVTWQAKPGTTTEGQSKPYVKSLSYRNLAPLYVDEEMKVCLRRTKTEADRIMWDVWIEGPEGGLAVKGSAMTLVPDKTLSPEEYII